MKKHLMFILLVVFFVVIPSSSEAVIIDWAGTISNTNAFFADEILDKPDGIHAMFGWDTDIGRYGTVSDFGKNDSLEYNSLSFAQLLGVSNSVINSADFLTVEFNGGNASIYENGLWEFSDVTNSLAVDYKSENPGALAPVIAYENIDNVAYSNYFSFTNPTGEGNQWAFLLFDIDGYSNVNPFSNNFNVTLTTLDNGGPTSPDPDVMGRINAVPEPASIALLVLVCLECLLEKNSFPK